jgi:protease IV
MSDSETSPHSSTSESSPSQAPLPANGPQSSTPSAVDETTKTKGAWGGWFWVSISLLCVLAFSVFANGILGLVALGSAAGSGIGHSVYLDGYKSTLVDGKADSDDFIAIVPVQGVIMEAPTEDSAGKGSLSRMTKLLAQLEKQDNLKGILLLIDSPGGGVTTSDLMHHELKRFKEKKKVPVLALFQDVAASGGYYVAMTADHVMAHRTSVTGSIGVISHFFNMTDLMNKVGVKMNTVKSLNSAGKESFKDIGSPYRPMRPEEQKLIQEMITSMWNRFVDVVAEGRKGKLSREEVAALADGRIFAGPAALEKKLIDSVGYPEEAYAKIRELAKSTDAKVLRFSKEKDWDDLFQAQSNLKIPGAQAVERLLGEGPESRFLYLWDGR